MFTDAIMTVLEWIYGRIGSVTNGGSGLTETLEGFSKTIFNWCTVILNSVAMPVATIILVLFALLEIHHASMTSQNTGISNIPAEMIMKIFIKIALAKLALDSIAIIMQSIYQITTYLTDQVIQFVHIEKVDGIDVETIRSSIEGVDWGMQLVMLIVSFVVFLVTWVATLYAEILIASRFVEIYVLFAMSPIPTATLFSQEQSSIGKNFLKSFGAVCLQGTLIYLVLTFFPILMKGAFEKAGDSGIGAVMSALGYSLVLIFSISGTGKWSKAILGTG